MAVVMWATKMWPHDHARTLYETVVAKIEQLSNSITLIQGDCRDILPTLEGVDCVVTDPPYNVGKNYGAHDDKMKAAEYAQWAHEIVQLCLRVAPNQFWVAPRYKMELWLRLLPGAHIIVIPRGASGPLRNGWIDQYQTALAIGKPNTEFPDLWKGIRLKGEGYFFREDTFGHPGYTPYLIMERAVSVLSSQSVCDPFCGTGTTAIAAIKTGRRFVGIELELKWFDIACKRASEALKQPDLFIATPSLPAQQEFAFLGRQNAKTASK
jgi:site-specific DNA-methyltransferase (adenine-specific)/modification methylase